MSTHFTAHFGMVLKRMFRDFSWARDLTISTAIALVGLWIQLHFGPAVSGRDKWVLILSVVGPYIVVFGAHLCWRAIRAPWQVHREQEDAFEKEKESLNSSKEVAIRERDAAVKEKDCLREQFENMGGPELAMGFDDSGWGGWPTGCS